MPGRSIHVFLVIILASFLTLLITCYQAPATKESPVLSNEVSVAARVGDYYIDILTGWTSPFAEVTLSGKKLIRKTIADKKGYFEFNLIPVHDDLGELCLISQDINLLPSFPTCLPSPSFNPNIEIKDVFLPPTISVENDKIPAGKTAKASGMTVPDTEVDVYLFTENNDSFQFLKKAHAVGLPIYRIGSNENGYFEFSLPASAPSQNGIFATAILKLAPNTHHPSPKSNTLYFQALGFWGILKLFLENFFKEILKYFASIKSNPAKIILLETITLIWLGILILVSKLGTNKHKNEHR